MAVSQVKGEERYVGSGYGPYPITFPYDPTQPEEIKVRVLYADGAVDDLALTTDYYVTSGSVYTVLSYNNTYELLVYREAQQIQEIDFRDGSAVRANNLENRGLDRLVYMVQDLYDRLARALQVDRHESDPALLPKKTERAGKWLRFDANGDPIASHGSAVFISGDSVWDAGTEYNTDDIVAYGGTMWVAQQAHTGVTPGSDASYWVEYGTGPTGPAGPQGEKGDTGDQGPPGTANWDSGTTYDDGDLVFDDGQFYESQQGSNTGNDPSADDGTWWTLREFGSDPWGESEVKTADATLDSTAKRVVYADASDRSIEITLPRGSDVPDKEIRIVHERLGSGLIQFGDCESDHRPMLRNGVDDTSGDDDIDSVTRVTSVKHSGSSSYRVIVAAGVSGQASVALSGGSVSTGYHRGLAKGLTYRGSAWVNTPASGGEDPGKISLAVQFYTRDGKYINHWSSPVAAYDEWQRLELEFVVPPTAMTMIYYVKVDNATAGKEFFIDDVALHCESVPDTTTNLIEHGGAEADSQTPRLVGETTPVGAVSCDFTRVDLHRSGSKSYRMTTNASGSYYRFVDADGKTDLHGLTAGKVYTIGGWFYRTLDGVTPVAVNGLRWRVIKRLDTNSWGNEYSHICSGDVKDEWVYSEYTFRMNGTGIVLDIEIAGAAAGDTVFIDDLFLYEHPDHPVRVVTLGDDGAIGNRLDHNVQSTQLHAPVSPISEVSLPRVGDHVDVRARSQGGYDVVSMQATGDPLKGQDWVDIAPQRRVTLNTPQPARWEYPDDSGNFGNHAEFTRIAYGVRDVGHAYSYNQYDMAQCVYHGWGHFTLLISHTGYTNRTYVARFYLQPDGNLMRVSNLASGIAWKMIAGHQSVHMVALDFLRFGLISDYNDRFYEYQWYNAFTNVHQNAYSENVGPISYRQATDSIDGRTIVTLSDHGDTIMVLRQENNLGADAWRIAAKAYRNKNIAWDQAVAVIDRMPNGHTRFVIYDSYQDDLEVWEYDGGSALWMVGDVYTSYASNRPTLRALDRNIVVFYDNTYLRLLRFDGTTFTELMATNIVLEPQTTYPGPGIAAFAKDKFLTVGRPSDAYSLYVNVVSVPRHIIDRPFLSAFSDVEQTWAGARESISEWR